MMFNELIFIGFIEGKLTIIIHWIVVIFLLLVFILFQVLLNRRKIFKHSFDIETAELGIGTGKITITPNYQDYQIAYELWVELSTRKIGLEIDINNDIIKDLYDSWYDFFRVTRSLIKSIPINKYIKSKDTREIVKISIDVLNLGIRPHLTKWQAKYRYWLDNNQINYINCTPQDIQKEYPEYSELIHDLLIVNKKLVNYREIMGKLINYS